MIRVASLGTCSRMQLKQNQHSLHDIYVHGDLYPTHACTHCRLTLMHVHDCCRSLVGRSSIFCQPSLVLSGNTTCASTSVNLKLFHMSPPYLPICGIYLPFQVNLHVPNSKPSNNNLFCMPELLMQRLGPSSIFHARWVILTMSGLRSSFTRKWLVTGMPSPMIKRSKTNSQII